MWETRSPRSRVWAWSEGGSDWAPLGPSARALSYLPFFPSPNGEKEATFLVWGNLLLLTVPTQLTSAACHVSEKLVGTRINRVVYLPFVCVSELDKYSTTDLYFLF